MNDAEYTALQQPLSNAARVLYLLGLKPTANQHTGATQPLINKNLMELLNGKEQTYTLGRQINALVKELANAGLVSVPVSVDIDKSLNGQQLELPLLVIDDEDFVTLHQTTTSMHIEWQPKEQLFKQLCQLVGLIDQTAETDEIGDFVSYWLGRPQTQLTQFQWTQKFVSHLKRHRMTRQTGIKKQIGSQTVNATSGIQADENARKLVEKYATKK